MKKRQLTRAERRSQRSSDLRMMGIVTVGVVMCMASLFVWTHMTQDVKRQLNQLNGSSDDLSERREQMKDRIIAKRAEAAHQRHSILDHQRQLDMKNDRTSSSCPSFDSWRSEKSPCPPLQPDIKSVLVVTEHFGPSADYLFPQYDELGHWQLSLQQPTLWNILVNETEELTKLYCADPWLRLSEAFDPPGSLPRETVQAIESAVASLHVQSLLKNADFKKGLLVAVTHNVTAFVDKSAEHPDARLMSVFSKGMEFVIANLLPKPIDKWTVSDIERIHREVCTGEPEMDPEWIGRIRSGTMHVGFGFAVPPPLGFETPYLMQTLLSWIGQISASQCMHPILHAIQTFALIHRLQPFQNCNTRVAKLVMNAILLQKSYPPLHMFLHTSKVHLRSLEKQYYDGDPDPLLLFFSENILKMAEEIERGRIQQYTAYFAAG